jgi:hypothetical protein
MLTGMATATAPTLMAVGTGSGAAVMAVAGMVAAVGGMAWVLGSAAMAAAAAAGAVVVVTGRRFASSPKAKPVAPAKTGMSRSTTR